MLSFIPGCDLESDRQMESSTKTFVWLQGTFFASGGFYQEKGYPNEATETSFTPDPFPKQINDDETECRNLAMSLCLAPAGLSTMIHHPCQLLLSLVICHSVWLQTDKLVLRRWSVAAGVKHGVDIHSARSIRKENLSTPGITRWFSKLPQILGTCLIYVNNMECEEPAGTRLDMSEVGYKMHVQLTDGVWLLSIYRRDSDGYFGRLW